MVGIFKSTGVLILVFVMALMSSPVFAASKSPPLQNALIAQPAPIYLKLEFMSSCTEKGAIFKIVNHGEKWPQRGALRLYRADTKTVIGERKMRLGKGQKVSFIVKDSVSKGHPVAVWVEPDWYKRDFKFDANVNCN